MRGRLIVADIAVNNSLIRVVAVYAIKNQRERFAFFHRLGPFLSDSSR